MENVVLLPVTIYENRFEPNVGNWLYIVPESDSVVAEHKEITNVSHNGFSCGEYHFSCTGSFGHVGKNITANAYSSIAAYWAVKLIPKLGWSAHERRRDVFTRLYTNARLTPNIKRHAFIQIDHRDGCLVLLGQFLGEGGNMLAELSESFAIAENDPGAASKINAYLLRIDAIIIASYAMNVTRESARMSSAKIQSDSNFDRGIE
jgi:hypothetical protein